MRRRGFTLVELLASMALLALIALMVFTIFNQSTKVWKKAGARTDQYIAARAVLDQIARELRGAVMVPEGRFAVPDGGANAKGCMPFLVLHAGGPDDALQGWRDSTTGREQPCSDQIYFVAPVENSGKQDYCLIGYWVRDDEEDTQGDYVGDARRYENIRGHGEDLLMRHYVTSGTDDDPDQDWLKMSFEEPSGSRASDQFALNVKSLRIRCWSDYPDSSHFTEEWEDEEGDANEESKINWDTSVTVDALSFGPYDDSRLPKAVKITIVVQDEKEIEKEREFSTVVYLDNATR
jgi:prepilin-type N-terminal cleavage/methylation domain-containing protein